MECSFCCWSTLVHTNHNMQHQALSLAPHTSSNGTLISSHLTSLSNIPTRSSLYPPFFSPNSVINSIFTPVFNLNLYQRSTQKMQGPQLPNTSIRHPRPPSLPPQVPPPQKLISFPNSVLALTTPLHALLSFVPFVSDLPPQTLPNFIPSSPPSKNILPKTPPLLWCLFFVFFALFNFKQLQLHPFALTSISISTLLKSHLIPILLPNKQVPFLSTPPAAAAPHSDENPSSTEPVDFSWPFELLEDRFFLQGDPRLHTCACRLFSSLLSDFEFYRNLKFHLATSLSSDKQPTSCNGPLRRCIQSRRSNQHRTSRKQPPFSLRVGHLHINLIYTLLL